MDQDSLKQEIFATIFQDKEGQDQMSSELIVSRAMPLLQKAIEDQLINSDIRDNILKSVLAQLGYHIETN